MSLRLRLGLWYGGLTGLVVLLLSLLTYAVHSRAHYDNLDRDLASSAAHVAAESTGVRTPGELAAVLSAPTLSQIAVRLHAPGGGVLAASPNAGAVPPLDPQGALDLRTPPPFDPVIGLAPSLTPVDPGRGVFILLGAPGERWRLYVLPVGETVSYVVTAAPLAPIDDSIARFRQLVLLTAAVGAVVTLAAGWLLARRALRPVAALTATASGIARSHDFNRRVLVPSQHDELGQLADTFNAMLVSLEQAYQAQKQFVSDAGHELRAPLTAIQGNLDLLQRQTAMSEAERQEALAEAGRETRRLASLVADLLALARADAGVPLRRQRLELDRVFLDALHEARHLARGQRLEVEHVEPLLVQGDPDRLKQLLLILADNALKYTPAGGSVTLALRRNGAVAEITVRDTGVGIAPEDLPRVFERFYRADPARSRDPGGTGLGLPIARWIAEQHGGELSLASAPGRGTTATVRMPTAR